MARARKQKRGNTKRAPKRAGGNNRQATDTELCPERAKYIAQSLQYQMLNGRHPREAVLPADLTERNAPVVAEQLTLLAWDLPYDTVEFGKCYMTCCALQDCGLPDVVSSVLRRVLKFHADIRNDAATLIGLVMDARSPVASFIVGSDDQDALCVAILRLFMQFEGADESIVVGRLTEMGMAGKLKMALCWSLAEYLVTVQPGRYEYFFDVADSEEEQNTKAFQEARRREAIEEEAKRLCVRVQNRMLI